MASVLSFHSFSLRELKGYLHNKSLLLTFSLLLFLFVFYIFLCFFFNYRKKGLEEAKAASNNLPTFSYKSSTTDQEAAECCICLSNFEDGHKVKVLPKCSHRFHSECVDKWLRNCSNCPLCRTPLVEDQDSSEKIPVVDEV